MILEWVVGTIFSVIMGGITGYAVYKFRYTYEMKKQEKNMQSTLEKQIKEGIATVHSPSAGKRQQMIIKDGKLELHTTTLPIYKQKEQPKKKEEIKKRAMDLKHKHYSH